MLHNLALTWQALHDYERQVEYERRALRWSDSSYSVIWLGLLQGLVNAGQLDSARTTAAVARARFPDDRYLDWIDGYIAQNDGDMVTVDRVGRLLAGAPAGVDHVVEGNRLLADLHELRGRVELAAEYRRRAIAAAAADRRHAAVVEDLARLARVGAPDAPASRFAADLARHGIDTLAVDQRPFDALQLAWLALGLRGRAATEVALAREAGVEPGALVAALLSADSARARGETAGAIAAHRRAQAADDCPICRLPQLAEAYLTAEMTDSAIATYRRYLETPYIHRLASDAVHLERVLGELARLYEEEGQPERAEPLLQRAAILRGEALPTR
jgi:tetratricopeptide (TPR) repeat protein